MLAAPACGLSVLLLTVEAAFAALQSHGSPAQSVSKPGLSSPFVRTSERSSTLTIFGPPHAAVHVNRAWTSTEFVPAGALMLPATLCQTPSFAGSAWNPADPRLPEQAALE